MGGAQRQHTASLLFVCVCVCLAQGHIMMSGGGVSTYLNHFGLVMSLCHCHCSWTPCVHVCVCVHACSRVCVCVCVRAHLCMCASPYFPPEHIKFEVSECV